VVVSYFLISVASVVTVRLLPGRSWLKTLFVILDTLLTSSCSSISASSSTVFWCSSFQASSSQDHDRTRRGALKADQRRLNLSRFFSPFIVSELQERGETLGLERHNAAIMFVDLRDFTSSAETAPARNWR
jgi:hypothetical protein